MFRRTFLKTIGAIAAAAFLPISLIKTAIEKSPAAVCPCCGSENVSCKNGEFKCYNYEENCGAEGKIVVRLNVSKWPE